MKNLAAVLALSLLASAVAAPALSHADDSRDADDPAMPEPEPSAPVLRHSLAFVGGVGTPVGNVGVELARALIRRVDAAAGVGVSFDDGPQLALMLRPTYERRDLAFSIGAGASVGFEPSPLLRLNLEGGLQYTHESAWSARVFAGYSFVTAGGDADSAEPMCTYNPETYEEICNYDTDATSGPYVGISAGKRF